MYQPEKLKARRKELKLTQKEIAEELGISFQAYSAWERGIKEPSKEKVAQLENILKVAKGYFTQIEIVRLYNSLSKQGKDKVVLYARNLAQEEQTQKVTTMPERLYEYRVYERMSAGIGASVYDDQILIRSTLTRSWSMILHLGWLGTLWNLNIKMAPWL